MTLKRLKNWLNTVIVWLTVLLIWVLYVLWARLKKNIRLLFASAWLRIIVRIRITFWFPPRFFLFKEIQVIFGLFGFCLHSDWPSVSPLSVAPAQLSNSTSSVFGCGNERHILAAANCCLLQTLKIQSGCPERKNLLQSQKEPTPSQQISLALLRPALLLLFILKVLFSLKTICKQEVTPNEHREARSALSFYLQKYEK